MKKSLAIFVKEPLPGKVKTRLCPEVDAKEAAALYRGWAREAFRTAAGLESVNLYVAYEPLSWERSPDWLWEGCAAAPYFFQSGEDLGEKMRNAFVKLFERGAESAVLIGSDSPGLPRGHIELGFRALESRDLALGPTSDGGYYLIGLNFRCPDTLFSGVLWSTGSVFERTLENAARLGLKTEKLPEYFDIDRPEDLRRFQGTAP